jgi:hypothetical protein
MKLTDRVSVRYDTGYRSMKLFWLTPFMFGALCSAQQPSVTLDEAVGLALARHEDIGKARACAPS